MNGHDMNKLETVRLRQKNCTEHCRRFYILEFEEVVSMYTYIISVMMNFCSVIVCVLVQMFITTGTTASMMSSQPASFRVILI